MQNPHQVHTIKLQAQQMQLIAQALAAYNPANNTVPFTPTYAGNTVAEELQMLQRCFAEDLSSCSANTVHGFCL